MGGKAVTGRRRKAAEGSRPLPTKQKAKGWHSKAAGRACPAPTDCCENLRTRGAREGGSPPPFPLTGCHGRLRAAYMPPYRAAVYPCGGSGALGGAQRAPPVCYANPLVRLFAPRGQTLLAPQFRCAQLWPRARNPATPEFKVEEGAGALRTKSNTAFV